MASILVFLLQRFMWFRLAISPYSIMRWKWPVAWQRYTKNVLDWLAQVYVQAWSTNTINIQIPVLGTRSGNPRPGKNELWCFYGSLQPSSYQFYAMGSADARGVGVVCTRVFRFRSTTALLGGAARGACERQQSHLHSKVTVSGKEPAKLFPWIPWIMTLHTHINISWSIFISFQNKCQHRFPAKVLVSSQSSGAPGR